MKHFSKRFLLRALPWPCGFACGHGIASSKSTCGNIAITFAGRQPNKVLTMPRPYRRRDPDQATATAAEIAAREAERDARLDDRVMAMERLPPAHPGRPPAQIFPAPSILQFDEAASQSASGGQNPGDRRQQFEHDADGCVPRGRAAARVQSLDDIGDLMANVDRGGWLTLHFGMTGALQFVRTATKNRPSLE